MTRPFDRLDQLTLVMGTRTRSAPWYDFPNVGGELREFLGVFVINIKNTILTEATDSFSPGLDQYISSFRVYNFRF